jgi:preprotein translocase subunit SecA
MRGRGGRQGDPGSSRFYLSLEDDLMRIFAGDRIQVMMDRLGMEEDVPIEHPWVTKAVENAQTKVEQRNFDIRKHMLDYDDVMNQQRKSVYALRKQVLSGQYRTEPTKDERERGIVPPPRVEKADDRYLQLVSPPLESFIKLSAAAPLPRDATPEQQVAWRDAALAQKVDDLKQINTAQLEQAVYVNFGCQTELREFREKPRACLEALKTIVAMSLTEQRERLLDLNDEVVGTMVGHACPQNKHFEDWDLKGLAKAFEDAFAISGTGIESMINSQEIAHKLYDDAEAVRQKREREVGDLVYLRVFREFFLQEIDNQWLEHLQNMDALRDGIGLRGYGQRDPKKEYQKEGFELFLELMQNIKASVVHKMFHFRIEREDDVQRIAEERRRKLEARTKSIQATHAEVSATGAAAAEAETDGPQQAKGAAAARGSRPAQAAPVEKPVTVKRERPKVGRNDPCWCGSGKKYKSCHLKEDTAAAS